MLTNDRPIARNRFEEIGVTMQVNAKTWNQAVERFDKSCTLCSMHARPNTTDCNACPIRAALLANVEWHGISDKNYLWVEKEMSSD